MFPRTGSAVCFTLSRLAEPRRGRLGTLSSPKFPPTPCTYPNQIYRTTKTRRPCSMAVTNTNIMDGHGAPVEGQARAKRVFERRPGFTNKHADAPEQPSIPR